MVDYDDELNIEDHKEIFYSLGRYHAELEALNAFNAGEIEEWIEYITPKSLEEWEEWEKKYGEDFENRWKV